MNAMMEELFGETLQKTQSWLEALRDDLEWNHPTGLLAALRAGLHALRDRLGPGEAADLAAQLPVLIQGIYFQGWRPAAEAWKERQSEAFVARVAHDLKGYAELREPERVIRAVFRLLDRHVTKGEIEQVRSSLPAEVRAFWP